MQVQDGLPVGFVLGMEQRQRLSFVLGAQTDLFVGGGVFGVKNSGSLKHDESRFHRLILLNRETSPVSSAFRNASFCEFQQIPANSGE
jgi:hypothetical protein